MLQKILIRRKMRAASSWLAPLFAMLILGATLHCATGHGHIPRTKIIVDAGAIGQPNNQELPLAPETPSECHESGCICKGATLVLPFVVVDCDLVMFQADLCVLEPIVFETIATSFSPEQARHSQCCWLPLRALDRRAMLQSFLI